MGPKYRILRAPLLLVALLFVCSSWATASPKELTVAAVQLRVSEELYRSQATFARSVDSHVAEAVAAGSELLIFPEYAGVFLAALPYSELVLSSNSVTGALRRIDQAGADASTFREFFLAEAGRVSETMDAVFGAIAKEWGVHILAGTYFARSRTADGRVRLTNRALLYAPTGERVLEQDKVFLTPFEQQLLGLDAGRPEEVRPFSVEGLEVGVTICRDTFFDVWDTVHAERDLWVDIKADGVAFDDEARRRYRKTVPERLKKAGVPYGVTVSLVGEYLDLFWEGRTSAVA